MATIKGTKKVGMKRHLKLCCAGEGENFRWMMAVNKAAAASALGPAVRYADSDDIRALWHKEKLYELTVVDLEEKFGVSRQAIDMWKKKGGADLKSRSDFMHEETLQRIEQHFDPTKSAMQIARDANTNIYIVKEIAAQKGVVLPQKSKKRPSDEEIIRLAEGRTWRELASACGVTLHTLRNYIYPRPELAAKVCPLLKPKDGGTKAHGVVDVIKLAEMYRAGSSAYQISNYFGVEIVTTTYWLKKLGLRADTASVYKARG